MLSATRDMDAAQRFFRSAQSMAASAPIQVTTDGHDSYPRAIRETLGPKVKHRCSAYMNRRIERDHRGVKQRYLSNAGLGGAAMEVDALAALNAVRMTSSAWIATSTAAWLPYQLRPFRSPPEQQSR